VKCRWLVCIGILTARVATADDAKKDDITVLPWSQASVVFAEGDKSASVSYAQLFGDEFMFYGKASAPLDSDTRLSAFTSDNKLAKGFSGTFQFGYDERAAVLADLDHRVQLAIDGINALREGKIGQAIPFNDALLYNARHPEVPVAESAGMKRHFCKVAGAEQAACTELVVARELCKTFGTIGCATDTQEDQALNSARRAAQSIADSPLCRANRAMKTGAESDRCFLARWWLGIEEFAAADQAITQLAEDVETVDTLWTILKLIDPKKAEELKKGIKASDKAGKRRELSEILVNNLDTFKDAVIELKRSNPALARRDLLMTGLLGKPTREAQAIGIGFDVDYDALDIHQDDVAAKAISETKYKVTLAGDYTYYATTAGFSLNARVGVGRAKDPKGKKTELCTSFPSTDSTVTGKKCDKDALFRLGAAPGPETTAFARVAITYQYGVGKSEDEVVPGVELRGGWERTGKDDSVTGRLSLFGTPIKGTTAARVGIALDVGYAINIGDAETRWRITPLVFVGASFSDLQTSNL
jgi:hypothetical protein